MLFREVNSLGLSLALALLGWMVVACGEPEVSPAPQEPAPPACTPSCVDKVCGSDGCGGVCGQCKATEKCGEDGACVCGFLSCNDVCCAEGARCHEGACCTLRCDASMCGPDGCGGACGACTLDGACDEEGLCQPAPASDEDLGLSASLPDDFAPAKLKGPEDDDSRFAVGWVGVQWDGYKGKRQMQVKGLKAKIKTSCPRPGKTDKEKGRTLRADSAGYYFTQVPLDCQVWLDAIKVGRVTIPMPAKITTNVLESARWHDLGGALATVNKKGNVKMELLGEEGRLVIEATNKIRVPQHEKPLAYLPPAAHLALAYPESWWGARAKARLSTLRHQRLLRLRLPDQIREVLPCASDDELTLLVRTVHQLVASGRKPTGDEKGSTGAPVPSVLQSKICNTPRLFEVEMDGPAVRLVRLLGPEWVPSPGE